MVGEEYSIKYPEQISQNLSPRRCGGGVMAISMGGGFGK